MVVFSCPFFHAWDVVMTVRGKLYSYLSAWLRHVGWTIGVLFYVLTKALNPPMGFCWLEEVSHMRLKHFGTLWVYWVIESPNHPCLMEELFNPALCTLWIKDISLVNTELVLTWISGPLNWPELFYSELCFLVKRLRSLWWHCPNTVEQSDWWWSMTQTSGWGLSVHKNLCFVFQFTKTAKVRRITNCHTFCEFKLAEMPRWESMMRQQQQSCGCPKIVCNTPGKEESVGQYWAGARRKLWERTVRVTRSKATF